MKESEWSCRETAPLFLIAHTPKKLYGRIFQKHGTFGKFCHIILDLWVILRGGIGLNPL